ncbi:hypothetical protein [Litoribacillus peritrichatus]|uniref:Uridine kinase n=1 Tax=Litoribacillus peritrichatus TaxID=718191 RepID=A0ABP7N5H8_9GAMM
MNNCVTLDQLVLSLLTQGELKKPLVVGVSGIDGSGKGFIGEKLKRALTARGVNTYLIGIDGWLSDIDPRSGTESPAKIFYEQGVRLSAFVEEILTPLKMQGYLDVVVQQTTPSSDETRFDRRFCLEHPDVVIIEGIFLFQPTIELDYRVWIDCSFETALDRALSRNQEGLTEEALLTDYRQIYFPAQKHHFEVDQPKLRADVILNNDPALQ